MLMRELGPVLGQRAGSCKYPGRELSAYRVLQAPRKGALSIFARAADKHTEFRERGQGLGIGEYQNPSNLSLSTCPS